MWTDPSIWPTTADPGWSTTGSWAFGVPLGGGSHDGDPTSGFTGANVYGYNLAGDYTDNMAAEYLTSTPIDLSGVRDTVLEFERWLDDRDPLRLAAAALVIVLSSPPRLKVSGDSMSCLTTVGAR